MNTQETPFLFYPLIAFIALDRSEVGAYVYITFTEKPLEWKTLI